MPTVKKTFNKGREIYLTGDPLPCAGLKRTVMV